MENQLKYSQTNENSKIIRTKVGPKTSLLLFRIIVVSYKSVTDFGQLLALGVGLPIIFQAYINMGVAVHLIPVTGQPLPLISSGGTSIWMTFLAIGIVFSVSVNDRED